MEVNKKTVTKIVKEYIDGMHRPTMKGKAMIGSETVVVKKQSDKKIYNQGDINALIIKHLK